MDMLDGLNPEQKRAVEHREGPMLVVAGAGTGKTQVITRRIAHLISSGAAKPGEVLALTFTEKAAREMEERLYELIGWESFQVPVMTFHAFGTELLARFATHSGRSIRGGLLNELQKALLLQQHYSQIQLKYYGPQSDTFEFAEGIISYIGQLQNAGISVEDYGRYVETLRNNPDGMHPRDIDEQADLYELYRLYERVKVETGTFDYSDQLELPLKILQERPNLVERLSDEYKFVLVDEYQDTNSVQDALLKAFVGPGGNMFAVGDDDQAIYGFRGAELANILAFGDYYRVSEPVTLTRNYRSGQQILDAAYRLIRHNDPERLESKLGLNKRLIAEHDASRVQYMPYGTPASELQGVAAAVAGQIDGGTSPGSMAVLASSHAPLRAMAKALRLRDIPYALSTSVNIFEQPELIGLWHLLRWLCLLASEEAIGHVVMGPYVGWTADQWRRIIERGREALVTTEESLRADQSPAALELTNTLDTWRGWSRELTVSQLVFKLVFETGRSERWRDQAIAGSGRVVRIFEDLHRFLEHLQDYETVAVDTTLAAYMMLNPKPPALEVNEPVGESEGVQLLTVHSSKGLEFDSVYLINCTQRAWSKGQTSGLRVPAALKPGLELPPEHEFRRLMYVAATRARRSLVVSTPALTQSGARQTPSTLLAEMFGPEDLRAPEPLKNGRNVTDVMKQIQQFYPLKSAKLGKMPFETADGWLELSVTALSGYDFCPFEFYTEHVLKITQPQGPQMAFGSTLHKIFEQYFREEAPKRPGRRGELHSLLDELWSDRGYADKTSAESDRELAHTTLDRFFDRENGLHRTVLGSETPIRFELPEAKLRLRGKIDAIFTTPDGVEIRDFKTGRTKTDPEKLASDAKSNFQLRSYALAYEALQSVTPARVVLDYVVTGVEGAASLSAAILRNHREKLVRMAEKIRAREFAANPSAVHRCSAIRYYGTGERDELMDEVIAGDV